MSTIKNNSEVKTSVETLSTEPTVEKQSILPSQVEIEIEQLINQIPESILELEDGLKKVDSILTSLNNEVKSIGLQLKPVSKSDPNTISGLVTKLTSNQRRILKTKRSLIWNYIKKAQNAFELLSSKLKLKSEQEQKKQQRLGVVINSKSPTYMKRNLGHISKKIDRVLASAERSTAKDPFFMSLKKSIGDPKKFRKSFSDFLGSKSEDLGILALGSPIYLRYFSNNARNIVSGRNLKKNVKHKSNVV